MRAKILAASIICVVCASGTAAHAGPPPRTFLIVLEEMAARWFGRAAPELELSTSRLSTSRTLQGLEPAPSTRPLGGYHSPYETQGIGQSNDLVRQFAIPKHDYNFAAPTEDSTASAATDKTSKAGPLIGGSITTGATLCALSNDCPRTMLKMKN